MSDNSRLILASASPRRQQLLREARFSFEVHPADIDEESYPKNLSPQDIALWLAKEKAAVVAKKYPTDIILAADTIVVLGQRILSKPDNANHAREMLRFLSNTTQLVITGIAIARRSPPLEISRFVTSTVQMRPLTDAEIDAYIATNQWRGKAGAYGIQDRDPFVTRMTGSLSNIVGLPMEATTEMLMSVGVRPAT